MRRFWSRLHFLIRFLGLTGLFAAGVGAVLAYQHGLWPGLESAYHESWSALGERVNTLLREGAGEPVATAAVYLVAGGAAAALVALLVELLGGLGFTAGRRSAFGVNAAVQVVLAVALLAGVNWWSFGHYQRLDWTRGRQFTIDPKLQEELRRLQPGRGQTTVVVDLRHRTFGQLSEKQDAYDSAAGRKVAEKVNDLVEQLREFGQQFAVEVLDVNVEG